MNTTINRRVGSTANRSGAEIGTSLSATSTPIFTAVSTSGSCIRKRAAMLCALSIALPWIPTMVAANSVGEDLLENSASSVKTHQSSLKRVDGWNDRDGRVVQPHHHTCEPASLSGDSDSSTTTAALANLLYGQAPANAVTLNYRKPAVTPPRFTTAAAATSAPNVARGTLMVSVDCSNDYNENRNKSPTSPKRERSPQDRRRQRPEKRGKGWGGQGTREVLGGRGLASRSPSELLESRDEALVSNRDEVPRDSGWRTGSNDGETPSTRSEATKPGVLSSSAQNQAAGAGIGVPSHNGDGQQYSPLPAQQAESQTPSPPPDQQRPSSSQRWVARAGESGGIMGSPLGVLASQGDGSMIAVFAGVMMAALPELLRACKLMAVAGIAFRGMRWLTGVIRAARPRMMWRHEDDWPECRAKRGQAIKEGGVSLRRAREESLRLRASGMRVPFDVISGLDEAELEVSADIVDCDEIDVMFGDIAGMEDIKLSLQEIISEPLDFPPNLYPARLIKPCTGVLIYGPPGCGKTLLARAVAKQSGAAFISVKASTLIRQPGLSRMDSAAGGGGGYSSLMVKAVFSLAKKIQPCIVFFDEADGLCLKREEGDAGSEREVMTELMQLWDGLSSSGQDRVVVLAATNRPWDLDPAIQVRLPDRQMRKAVLMKALEDIDVEEGFDWREVAVMTEGYSCGDVVELCREAVRGPLREAIERNRRLEARRLTQGLHQTRLNSLASQREQQQQQQQQQQRRWRHRGEWEAISTRDAGATPTTTIAAAAASAEAVQLPHVRMRPLRMSDITTAQRRVVPTFWQAEAYRTTYDSYMCSLMEHAKKNWSQ